MEVTMGGRNILEESSVYQEAMRRGEAKGVQKAIVALGSKRFGPPNAALDAHLKSINDVARLERMFDNLAAVNTWDELLAIE
jgi:hypothetical protein